MWQLATPFAFAQEVDQKEKSQKELEQQQELRLLDFERTTVGSLNFLGQR
jgi:hypothetical protein